jgi:GNAT superfamily N-acetyltransferase
MLVKLYELPPLDQLLPVEVTIRRALGPEREPVLAWVAQRFGPGWRGECAVGFGGCPSRVMLALHNGELLGFAAWDVTARGLFGPTGVDPAARGLGLGKALLLHSLHAMAAEGYAYAVIGGAGPTAFYQAVCGATPIPGSEPGLYRGLLR